MKNHQSTEDFLAFAESKMLVGQEVEAVRLRVTADRWCREKCGSGTVSARKLSEMLFRRGWERRRVASGVLWTFTKAVARIDPARAAAADAEAEEALRPRPQLVKVQRAAAAPLDLAGG